MCSLEERGATLVLKPIARDGRIEIRSNTRIERLKEVQQWIFSKPLQSMARCGILSSEVDTRLERRMALRLRLWAHRRARYAGLALLCQLLARGVEHPGQDGCEA